MAFNKLIFKFEQLQERGRDLFRTLSNIYDGVYCENSKGVLAINHFHKQSP